MYSRGCSSRYYVACVTGQPTIMRCPAHLKYDAVSDSCLDREYVGECGGTSTAKSSTAAPTTAAASTAETAAENPTDFTQNPGDLTTETTKPTNESATGVQLTNVVGG
ncbi:hypothetical protein Tcan_10595 [Toxocara canis]|uniref:Chitin-binding type-2 domain-containing protein n=1 Tax=Toxocara canis TaxID=6265 RepID=A0A0B2UUN7_TOXCA|nr:hypothetical protein Tcan_10595 [Toxocara canis]